ncbi:MAG: hypothetical protein ABH950_05900 [Candidatus Altiarchaeota archaeon]
MKWKRLLVISKYEMKQYQKSHLNVGSILGICLVSLLLLVNPSVKNVELPSAQRLYRIGFYQEGDIVSWMRVSFPFRMIYFQEILGMVEALEERTVDGGLIIQGNIVNVMGSGTMKSDGALNRIEEEFKYINNEQIRKSVNEQPEMAGILLPLRVQVIEEEVDYEKIINGSLDIKRKRFLQEKQSDTIKSFLGKDVDIFNDQKSINVKVSGAGGDGSGTIDLSRFDESGSGSDSFGASGIRQEESLVLPDELRVDFPFMNLFRNMMFLAPSIILSLMFSLSLIREKVDRSLNNLFSAPLGKLDIILGKALPYIVLMTLINVIYGLSISSGFEALKVTFIFMSVSIVILSTGLFSVVISRSYRELTFIGSFYIFIFLFMIVLPNVFAGINALALISPISHITSIENGASISWIELILSLFPYHILTVSFLAFTVFTFDADVLFSDWRIRDIVEHYHVMLSHALRNSAAYVFVSVALIVPFVFLIESIFSYLIIPLGRLSSVTSLLIFAAIEELAKITPFIILRKRLIKPLYYGILAGTSFFVTERIFNIYLISKIFSYFGGPYLYFIAKNLLATWGLHIVTVVFMAYGFTHLSGRVQKTGLFILIVLLHFVYNLNLVYQIL